MGREEDLLGFIFDSSAALISSPLSHMQNIAIYNLLSRNEMEMVI